MIKVSLGYYEYKEAKRRSYNSERIAMFDRVIYESVAVSRDDILDRGFTGSNHVFIECREINLDYQLIDRLGRCGFKLFGVMYFSGQQSIRITFEDLGVPKKK